MPAGHKHMPRAQAFGCCSVAVLEPMGLFEEGYLEYLSSREKKICSGIRNAARRDKWLAGRLSAKYLFLNHRANCIDRAKGSRSVRFVTLTGENIRFLHRWIYEKAEVLPIGYTWPGYPQLFWCGRKSGMSISLSHTDGLSCACISDSAMVGVDIEQALPRDGSFYRNYFTKTERHWAENSASCRSIRPEWLYTVLWTLKEAALKATSSDKISIIDLSSIEIRVVEPYEDLHESAYSSFLAKDLLFLMIEVHKINWISAATAALAATSDVILSIISFRGR